ncbi:MAG: hypothetical protein K2M78_08470 [Lachnospiraceae bacterium]|nr:hypothetical protein [Lachnospiraceae bacterium]
MYSDSKKKIIKDILIEILFCLMFLVVFWDAALISKYTVKDNMILVVSISVILNSAFIFLLVFILISNWKKIKQFNMRSVKNFLINNWGILCICLAFVIFSLSILDMWLMGDGDDYYRNILYYRNWDFEGILKLKMANHNTQTYTMWLLIGEFLLPGNAYGVRLILILMGMLTILAFYGIIKSICANAGKLQVILLTAIFAFSPGLFGMLGEINTDFPMLCFFTWMFYFHIKQKYILQSFCGILLCFSKEPGVVIYGCYMLGAALGRFFDSQNTTFKERVTKTLNLPFILNCIAGVCWIANYIFIDNSKAWGANVNAVSGQENNMKVLMINTFTPYFDYMIHKLKQMFFVNYGWIYWGIIFIFAFIYIFNSKRLEKQKINLEMYLAIFGGMFGFYNFNLLYLTWPTYRYSIPLLFFQMLLFSIAVCSMIKKKNVRIVCSVIILVITIWTNFYSEPLSTRVFRSYDVGKGKLVTTTLFNAVNFRVTYEAEQLEYAGTNNSSVINRQYSYRGDCFEELLEKIDYDSNTLIVIPDILKMKYKTYELYFGRNEAVMTNSIYWNKKSGKLNINNYKLDVSNNSEYIKLNLKMVEEEEDLEKAVYDKYDRIYYVMLPTNEDYDSDRFLFQYKDVGRFSIKKNIWKYDIYQIK